ncbi:DUF2285 domain-containing protein [Sphingobium fuliginis]|uniref:T6SS Transcription factor RovC-like DNA binding domain-containing protein n=3 Tax=Sphingomonadaceae TaxID=41297 RepID=A0ABQ1ENA5_SPHSA|nr:DUF2285 domain-containing protein [Sphingobium sp. Ndbn-10]RYM00888.1 DUF2285 domain-containing protein [Sphingobium fuliginis]GFZ79670.1 hypothetical protein GCM10019071_05580 [Sphingobium fuliginis]
MIEGTFAEGVVPFVIEMAMVPGVPVQADAALILYSVLAGPGTATVTHERLAGGLLSLWAFDLHAAGASLRDTADLILGPGDWPGDGECRKSRIRRLVTTGRTMVAAGVGSILADRSMKFKISR